MRISRSGWRSRAAGLLMDSLLASEGKAATTDDAMKKVYEDASKQITGEQEVHARHILVETEGDAKAIAEELKKGADFAELAKKKSRIPARPTAAISASSPRIRWCRNSRPSRSRSSPARSPIR